MELNLNEVKLILNALKVEEVKLIRSQSKSIEYRTICDISWVHSALTVDAMKLCEKGYNEKKEIFFGENTELIINVLYGYRNHCTFIIQEEIDFLIEKLEKEEE
jgi:hypothetical protein